MGQVRLEEFKIKLPSDVIGMVTRAEILSKLSSKTINKMEYFRTRCTEMGKKYGMDSDASQRKINSLEKEVFSEWDDLILWEGNYYGYEEWKSKYEELEQCGESLNSGKIKAEVSDGTLLYIHEIYRANSHKYSISLARRRWQVNKKMG